LSNPAARGIEQKTTKGTKYRQGCEEDHLVRLTFVLFAAFCSKGLACAASFSGAKMAKYMMAIFGRQPAR